MPPRLVLVAEDPPESVVYAPCRSPENRKIIREKPGDRFREWVPLLLLMSAFFVDAIGTFARGVNEIADGLQPNKKSHRERWLVRCDNASVRCITSLAAAVANRRPEGIALPQ